MPRTSKKKQKLTKNSLSAREIELKELGLDFKQKFTAESRKRPETQKAIDAGRKAAYKGDWAEAARHLLVAWESSPNDLAILTVLAHALVQLGVREKAIAVLEMALRHHEPTPEICSIMLEMAIGMELYDIAIKLGHHLINMAPNVPDYYVNLATSYSGAGRYAEAIEFLQGAVPKFPEHSDLWNVLGTVVRLEHGHFHAEPFFKEAIRLMPDNFKALSNYSTTLEKTNRYEPALEYALRASAANPASPEPHINAALLYFRKGDMAKAWDAYEYRLDTRRKREQVQIYTHRFPRWQGEDLTGKSLFVAAEQGIGDELMFGNYLPFLYDQAGQLLIGCEKRLVSIYRRRFPNAVVAPFADGFHSGYRYRQFPAIEQAVAAGQLSVDYAVPLASAPRYAWRTPEDVRPHTDGFVFADTELKEKFAARIAAFGNKPKVGLAWRSGVITGMRKGTYVGATDLGPLMALGGQVDFINLQYGEVDNEIREIKERFGVDVHVFEDVDLKQDIEANLAIMANCTLVTGALSAPAMFSLSSGVPTILFAPGCPWWTFGIDGRVPFARNAVFPDNWDKAMSWEGLVGRVAGMVRERLKLA